jgi:hypothetical protein
MFGSVAARNAGASSSSYTTQPVTTNYSGTVELHVAGHRIGDVLLEDIVRALENNAGDGKPVGPTTRVAIALSRVTS